MMTITVNVGGKPETFTWKDGELTGKPVLVELVKTLAEVMDGEEIGPVGGPSITSNYLDDPLATLMLILEIFEVLEADGYPTLPQVPDGAII